MLISVFGNRDILDTKKVVDSFHLLNDKLHWDFLRPTFLYGGTKGVQDTFISEAKQVPYDTVIFKPWTQVDPKLKFTPRMFFMRTLQILENSNMVIIITNETEDTEVRWVMGYCEQHSELEVIKIKI